MNPWHLWACHPLACLVAVVGTAAASEKNGNEPPGPPDLLFRASFDRLTAFADFAKGDSKSSLDASLELRAKPGAKGNCLLLDPGEKCVYQGNGNLYPSGGTVSLWIKPANWSDADNRFVYFLVFQGRFKEQPNKGFTLVVDKPDNPNTARALLTLSSRGQPDFRQYMAMGKADWKPDLWNKLDMTWNARHLAIYVNGKLAGRQDLPGTAFPELTRMTMELVPVWSGPESQFRSSKDRTYVDNVEIFGQVHLADRILERYLADRPGGGEELPVPMAVVPRATGVRVDGRLDDAEWQHAARVPIFVDIRTGLPHSEPAYAWVCHDATWLYIALWSPKRPGPLAAKAVRDGAPSDEDAFEVYLSPSAEASPHFFQWIINSAGTVLDAQGGKQAWNSSRTVVKTAVSEDQWTAEMAIPFADLKAAAPSAGQTWRGNFCRDWNRPKPAGTLHTTWAYGGPSYSRPERFAKLVFGGENGGAQLAVAPGLPAGRLRVEAASPLPARVNVSVAADGKTVFSKEQSISVRTRVETKLANIQTGTLAVTIEGGPDRQALQSFHAAFLVKQPISVAYVPGVPARKLCLEMDLSALDADWMELVGTGRASLEITACGPKGDRSHQTVKLTGPVATAEIPCQFREGTYEMAYVLRSTDRTDALTVEETLSVPDVSWVGSRTGVSDKVLDPWTPLVCDSKEGVNCWGRRYELEGPLPKRVVNQGHDILRGPVRLTIETESGCADLAERTRRQVSQTPARVEFAGAASFGNLGVNADWSCWMEYDGLAVGSFTIKPPPQGMHIKSLVMRLPLCDRLKHLRGARQNPNRLDWDGEQWQSAFEPFLWLTSEDEGFLYFCESEANWVSAPGTPMTILRGGAEPEIELRIIGQPVTVKEPLRYQFGFQATPVKPLDRDWREQNYGPGGTPFRHQNLQPWMNGYTQYDGLWHVARPDALRKFHEQVTGKGIRVYYYATTSCTPNNSPAYALFRKLWDDPYPAQFGPSENPESKLRPATSPYFLVPVCPGAPTFIDYQLWLAKRLAEEISARGFYTDTDDVWPCDNRRHGCGFTDVFGKSGVTWGILNKREFSKRMAALMRSLGGERGRGYWLTHAHSKLTPPVHCFADAFYPGEEYTHKLYNNKWYYIADMPEVDYRVQLSPLSSGMVHAFLPEFWRGSKDEQDIKVPGPTESLLAMCAVNDVNCTASYMHRDSMEEWWGLRKRLGLSDAVFTAYWRPNSPVKTPMAEARASVYAWPGRASIVIAVANRREQDAEIVVDVDWKAVGLSSSAAIAVDERTGQRLSLETGRFTVPVKARNYTFVSLK